MHARRWDEAEHVVRARSRLTAALAGTRWLRDAGLGFVVAPLPDSSGRLLRALDGRYVLALYPFVEGRTHTAEAYPDRATRAAVVGRLAALHAVDPSECAEVLADDFALPKLNGLREAMADLTTPWDVGPFAEPTRALVARHEWALTDVIERYLGLAASVLERGADRVLTHGEPHPGNTIGTDAGVVLIDWDTLLLAPPERDLWSLHDEDPDVLDVYRMLTRRTVDPDALHLYRLRWDLAEICLYVTQFHRRHDRSADTTEAWNELQHYLDPARWSRLPV